MNRRFVDTRVCSPVPTRAARPRWAPGFSLIEVLISVVILALGLLGLAAVFPVVVTQQRQSAEAVQGASIERSVGDYLVGLQSLSAHGGVEDNGRYGVTPAGFDRSTRKYEAQPSGARTTSNATSTGWSGLLSNEDWSSVPQGEKYGDWIVPSRAPGVSIASNLDTGEVQLNPQTGDIVIAPANSTANPVAIPMVERLIPRPYSADGVEPRYVWDIAVRRVEAGLRFDQNAPQAEQDRALADDTMQVAIFVRRIDPNIRVTPERTLSDVLTGAEGVTDGQWRVPVAADPQGRPTLDGVGTADGRQYSNIDSFAVELPENATARDLVTINDGGNRQEVLPFVRQVGQRFVDPSGTVQTVIEVDTGANTLRLRPGLSGDVPTQTPVSLLFTPQIPAAVRVMDLKPQ